MNFPGNKHTQFKLNPCFAEFVIMKAIGFVVWKIECRGYLKIVFPCTQEIVNKCRRVQ